ncbi:Integrase catalytic region [Sulfobacillus acidophilus DSM 10332]|uniref:Integrase catalytic region n=1 Tax=Sulfobacillus acidophilus (strain ATCC 700253 / DSM 10332 / NAL) TaxID=679936 RepID=G8U104_SULAD|nr:Integrase catalytic region [Sulfobacillus acidophilus DSM 10332]
MIPMSQTYAPEFKQQVVREVRETGNAALVARQHQLNPSMVRRWVREALTAEYPDPQALSLAEENVRLKRLLAERDLQIAMLQDFLRKKGDAVVTELCEQVHAWAEAYPQVPLQVWCATVHLPRGSYYAWRRRQLNPSEDRRRAAVGHAPVGYSTTQTGHAVSDDQIMAWILAILEQENPLVWLSESHGGLTPTVWVDHQSEKGLSADEGLALALARSPPEIALSAQIGPELGHHATEPAVANGHHLRIYCGRRPFFYVQAILDVCDRSIVAYHIGLTCRAADAAQTLQRAVQARQTEWGPEPPVIRTDNGPQFTAHVFEAQCQAFGLTHERIPVATPNANAYIEAWHALLDRECLSLEFATYAEAYAAVTRWIAFYNQRRLHGALGYRSPAQMRHAVANGQAQWTPLCA